MKSTGEDELSLKKGDMIYVIEKSESGWWKGRCDDGRAGWLPASYLRSPTSQEMQEKKKVSTCVCVKSALNFVWKLKLYFCLLICRVCWLYRNK